MGKKSNRLLRKLNENEDTERMNRRSKGIIDIWECDKKMSHIEEEIGIGIDMGKVAREQEK